jgi:hypothetical protein
VVASFAAIVAPPLSTLVRGVSVRLTPARPALLLLLVAFLPSATLAVNFLLKPVEPVQIRVTPKPHGPAVAYAQLGAFYPTGCQPPLQRHG